MCPRLASKSSQPSAAGGGAEEAARPPTLHTQPYPLPSSTGKGDGWHRCASPAPGECPRLIGRSSQPRLAGGAERGEPPIRYPPCATLTLTLTVGQGRGAALVCLAGAGLVPTPHREIEPAVCGWRRGGERGDLPSVRSPLTLTLTVGQGRGVALVCLVGAGLVAHASPVDRASRARLAGGIGRGGPPSLHTQPSPSPSPAGKGEE